MIKKNRILKSIYKNIGGENILQFLGRISNSIFSALAILIYLGLLIANLVTGRTIKFVYVYCNRIGHLASETELFLRRMENGIYDRKSNIYIGLCSDFPVTNRPLLTMFKRKFLVIENRILDKMIRGTWLRKTRFYHVPPFKDNNEFNSNEFYEFSNFKPSLYFTQEEEAIGKKMLAEMGIGENDWFVCFHARDPVYLSCHRLDFRNSDINNYLMAMEYIANLGGYAVRMGSRVEKPLIKQRNPRIIDYAADYRSDFMDIYLSAKCKFFLGDGCGINQVAQIFNVPVAWANVIPLKLPPFSGRDRFIPKKIWNNNCGRLLTFGEIIENGVFNYYATENYERAGFKIIEHSPQEILYLAVELNECIDGRYKYTSEDEELQQKYQALFKEGMSCYGCPARVGAKYLRENRMLLE